jgi:hypothetical protein
VKRDYWPKLQNAHGRIVTHITRSARDELQTEKTLARNECCKTFFSVRACDDWKKLPIDVKQAKTIGQLKKLLDPDYKSIRKQNPVFFFYIN